ncbi:MAG: GyrI-like domain-containing protein [Alphaproteobacteria bacterium]
MKKEIVHIKNEIKLVGLKTRTSNSLEIDFLTAKISNLIAKEYYGAAIPEKILNRINPGLSFGAYSEYESDHTGEYDYFIGEEVSSFGNISNALSTLVIHPGSYLKFTSNNGEIPHIIIDSWNKIWKMNNNDFGGMRKYKTDFEIYNQNRAEIYIGIELEA